MWETNILRSSCLKRSLFCPPTRLISVWDENLWKFLPFLGTLYSDINLLALIVLGTQEAPLIPKNFCPLILDIFSLSILFIYNFCISNPVCQTS